jgi:GNAT superfamily N-acetyltransferase
VVTALRIEAVHTASLVHAEREELLALCSAAYNEELSEYLDNAGPGVHLLGRERGVLVSHAMLVERALQTAQDARTMRTGYVELVATHPKAQRRGYASQLLHNIIAHMRDCEIAALSPSDERFYERLGWEMWRGPLSVRTADGIVAAPGEQVMVLRLPGTAPELDLDAALSIEWRAGEVW